MSVSVSSPSLWSMRVHISNAACARAHRILTHTSTQDDEFSCLRTSGSALEHNRDI